MVGFKWMMIPNLYMGNGWKIGHHQTSLLKWFFGVPGWWTLEKTIVLDVLV